jgi:hypothetical protein
VTRHILAAVVLLAVPAAAAPAQTFDFDAVPIGQTTAFTLTSDGLSAAFASSPADAYEVESSAVGPAFQALTGRYLYQPFGDATPLLVTFGSPLSVLSLNFALSDPGTLTLEAFLGATSVGSVSATGSIPPGFGFLEGALAFSGGPFDNVRLFSPTAAIAVDNLAARPASVIPEPVTVALVGAGLAALGGAAARRRRAAA